MTQKILTFSQEYLLDPVNGRLKNQAQHHRSKERQQDVRRGLAHQIHHAHVLGRPDRRRLEQLHQSVHQIRTVRQPAERHQRATSQD